MPVLIDDFELTLLDDAVGGGEALGGETGTRWSPSPTLAPLDGEEVALAAMLDLLRERRARLLVD